MATTLPVSAATVSERIQAMRIAAEQSIASVEAYAASNAQALAKVVAAYRAILTNIGARIVQFQARVIRARTANPTDPNLIALERRTVELLTTWAAHAQGYMPYERPADDAEKGKAVAIGWAGIVIALAVAGAVIAVAFTGVAWAVVHYKEATILSDEVAIIEQNPALAEALAKLNQSAPSSAPPAPPDPPGAGGWLWFLGLLGLAGAAFYVVPKLGKG